MNEKPPLRVLYMEDNSLLARLVKRSLSERGYEVDIAPDGETGLDMIEHSHYDVIAVDQNMPRCSGLEVIQRLKERGHNQPTIMVTGSGSEQIAVEAMKSGVSDYLVKDPDGRFLALLPSLIDHVLLNRRLSDEKQRAEAALKQSELRIRALFEHSPDHLCMLSLDGVFLTSNGRISQSGLLSETPLLGLKVSDVLPPANANLFMVQLRRVVETKEETRFELKTVSPESTRIHRVILYPIVDEGQVAAVGGMIRDVTQQVEAQLQLQMTAELLARSNQDLERFAYVASHDLREPLRTVTSYLGLLKRRYDDKLDSDAQEFIQYATEAAMRMADMISDLLSLSRVGSQGRAFLPVAVDELLTDLTKDLATVIEEQGAVMSWGAMPSLEADRAQLAQVFQNLITNAIRFRSDAPPVVSIESEQTEREWIISVRDNGIGIKEEFFGRVFEVFQRLHTRCEYPGTGIGLAICRRIIERHGGRIWVESTPGLGSTFKFSLPLRPTPS